MRGTPGMRTTEFWLAIVAMASATALMFFGHLSDTAYGFVMAGSSGGYAVGRGLAKRGIAR